MGKFLKENPPTSGRPKRACKKASLHTPPADEKDGGPAQLLRKSPTGATKPQVPSSHLSR